MQVHLECGRTGLPVELPEQNVVRCLGYQRSQPLADPQQVVRERLAAPLGTAPLAQLAAGRRSACVVISDVTRPVPNRVLLPPILATLEQAGISREQILILVATGLHRPNLGEELAEMVGPEIAGMYRIENHSAEADHADLGVSPRGVPIGIDRRYIAAELKITTGLIEPHFMAGYSGGRKLICPGLAAYATITAWHSPRFLEHPNARAGVLEGNPVHEENTWIARRAGCDFIVNVVLDDRRHVLEVVAGDMEQAFCRGVQFVAPLVTATVAEPVDVVVTTAAGYPLDATFYQSIKGMVAAAEIVRPGGTVILAAGLSEGIGSAEFCRIYEENASLEQFMDRILRGEYFRMDQWQLEEFAKVSRKARIVVVSGGLPAAALERLFVQSAPSVEAAVADCLVRYGSQATIAVIPKGPYVLATLG